MSAESGQGDPSQAHVEAEPPVDPIDPTHLEEVDIDVAAFIAAGEELKRRFGDPNAPRTGGILQRGTIFIGPKEHAPGPHAHEPIGPGFVDFAERALRRNDLSDVEDDTLPLETETAESGR